MPQAETTPPIAPSALSWTILFILTGVIINTSFAIYALIFHPTLNSDFMAFWAYPKFAATHPIATIYTTATLQNFEQTLYPGFHSLYPYIYPPTLLIVTWWFNHYTFATAQTLWTLAGLAALIAAARSLFPKQNLATIALLASPAALLTGAAGETSFFTTAFILAGAATLPKKPLLAGLFFGLLTLKPQLGLLIPIALIALRAWPAIISASITTATIIAISCTVFPPTLWLAWAHSLPTIQSQYFAATQSLNQCITPAANLITLGLPIKPALLIQTLIAITLAATTYLTFRRLPLRIATAALLTATFIAVPHAYTYDTIPLTAALALLFETTNPKLPLQILAAIIYLAPLLLLTPLSPLFLYAIPISILYFAIFRLAFAKSPDETPTHEHQPNRIRP